MRKIILLGTHGIALAIGFALGIYLLPILIAPPSVEDLAGSDFLHWGTGKVAVSATKIVHMGELAPGPDYIVYLVPEFVEDEAGFNAIKEQSAAIGSVKTFDGFISDIPQGVDVGAYNTVLVWCETFGEFITAAKYR
jgi:hypothetical protein